MSLKKRVDQLLGKVERKAYELTEADMREYLLIQISEKIGKPISELTKEDEKKYWRLERDEPFLPKTEEGQAKKHRPLTIFEIETFERLVRKQDIVQENK